jgi:hypothetical protein
MEGCFGRAALLSVLVLLFGYAGRWYYSSGIIPDRGEGMAGAAAAGRDGAADPSCRL